MGGRDEGGDVDGGEEEVMREGMQMGGERKGKNLGMPRNGRMGEGTWSCIKVGKIQGHIGSLTITRVQ